MSAWRGMSCRLPSMVAASMMLGEKAASSSGVK